MVGQVLDEAQQQRGAQTGDSGQKSDKDDPASELERAPIHRLNLSPVPEICRRVVISPDRSPIPELDASSRPTLDPGSAPLLAGVGTSNSGANEKAKSFLSDGSPSVTRNPLASGRSPSTSQLVDIAANYRPHLRKL